MAADIIGLGLNAAAGGGVLGILGSLGGRVIGFFEKKRDQKHEVKKWDNDDKIRKHEIRLHEMTMEADMQEGQIELSMAQQNASSIGYTASIAHDNAIGQAAQWVINALRLVRPVLTLLLWIITAWIYAISRDPEIASSAVLAATAATFWWFGDRAPKAQVQIPTGNKITIGQ